MPDVIQLSCASCGAKLKITDDIERFACSNCGNEFLVRRGDGIVSLQPVVQGLSEILVENKRISGELALARLRAEIDELQTQLRVIKSDAESKAQVLARKVEAAGNLVLWAWFVVIVGVGILLVWWPGGAVVVAGGLVFVWAATSSLQNDKRQREAVLAGCNASITEYQARIAAKQREVDEVLNGFGAKANSRGSSAPG